MRAMRQAGLNTVYLWACWGWIEPRPGTFVFDDYDELIAEAGAAGLRVVINTVAEIQPFWIHRVLPGAQMVDHMGRPVVSSTRIECTVGLTPGGCTDDPELRAAMGTFLGTIAARYESSDTLVAWDLWNETRWAVQADGYACYCEHTRAAFRNWLRDRYGDLDALSRAWGRRYAVWEDVEPGKLPGRIYTDLMEFAAFLTDRARDHMRFRYDAVRDADPGHLIVAHAMNTASARVPVEFEQELSRGNDWDYTDFLDGFGASLFPLWFRDSVLDLGARIESARSAAQDRLYWVGELQGASAHSAIETQASVPGDLQQRWLWSAIGRGARAVNFWCWRDEVFSRESGGFGLSGNDGYAQSRLTALRRAADVLEAHTDLIDQYRPAPAAVGVIFDPDAYRMDWAQYGTSSRQASRSLWGYLVGLEKIQVPYDVIESRHHDRLADYKLLVVPWPLVINPELGRKLAEWTAQGGVLLVESEVDAYDALGYYRYPQDRPFARAIGLASMGRRTIESSAIDLTLGEFAGQIMAAGWIEPMKAEEATALATSGDDVLALLRPLGQGQVIAIGTFAGLAEDAAVSRNVGSLRSSAGAMTGSLASNTLASARALPEPSEDPLGQSGFTRFLQAVVRLAGAAGQLRCSPASGATVQWRYGTSGGSRLLFVVNHGHDPQITFAGSALPPSGNVIEDLASTRTYRSYLASDGQLAADLTVDSGGYAVLRWTAGNDGH
jgi:beta-galactosidase